MAHVFRAVWIDNYLNVELAAPECFSSWLLGRNTPIPISENAVEDADLRSVVMSRVAERDSSGVQIQIDETLSDGRGRWTTTLNAMAVEGDRVVWVDVMTEASGVWQRSILAPRIVHEMLLAGGQPMSGIDTLEVQPGEIDDEVRLRDFVGSLTSDERTIPYLLISGGNDFEHHSSMQKATRASEILAGVARVAVIDAALLEEFNGVVPGPLRLERAGARLYLPGAFQDPENLLISSSFYDEDISADQKSLGLQVASRIGLSSLWPQVPWTWTQFKRRLDERRREIQRAHRTTVVSSSAEAQAPHDLPDDIVLLQQQVLGLQEQLLDANILAEEAQSVAEDYKNRVVRILLSEDSVPSFARNTIERTINDVSRLAKWIVIPSSAWREIESLDTHASSGAWANDLAHLFESMERYAKTKSTRGFAGNYRNWCTEYGDYSDKKIALNESKSTKRDDSLVSKRSFEVDPRVDPSGRVVMLDHAKIQRAGSAYIPRVFFYDDTGGATGKMHIGFIGPHSLVPTSSF